MFEVILMGILFESFWNGYYWSGFNIVKIVIKTAHTSSIPAAAFDNSSIISSGAMNAKLPLWTAVVRFLPLKALVCVYINIHIYILYIYYIYIYYIYYIYNILYI